MRLSFREIAIPKQVGTNRDFSSMTAAGKFPPTETVNGRSWLWKTFAALFRIILRRLLSYRLRWMTHGDSQAADRAFRGMLARAAEHAHAAMLLNGATLRAARDAEACGRLLAACRLWAWNAQATGDSYKASRNMTRCARNITQGAVPGKEEDRKSVLEALKAWRCLAAVDPKSKEAQQGIAWCCAGLARAAEQVSDFAAAHSYWSLLLESSPNDPAALDGLRRALELGGAPGENKETPDGKNEAAAQILYERLRRTASSRYGSQYAAGKLLFDSGAPALAIPFLKAALERKRGGSEALVLLFRCRVALSQFDEAAGSIQAIAESENLAELPAQDLNTTLGETARGLSVHALTKIGKIWAADRQIARTLMPHLIARDLCAPILAMTEAISCEDDHVWNDSCVLETAAYLLRRGEQGRAVRLLARFSGSSAIANAFDERAAACEAGRMEQIVLAPSVGNANRLLAHLALAEHHLRQGRVARSAEVICGIDAAACGSHEFYMRQKDRLAAALAQCLASPHIESADVDRLARWTVGWLSESIRSFFAGSAFHDLCEGLAAAARSNSAPASSRAGRLREGYFAHHMERRLNQDPTAFVSDFACCEATLRYLDEVSQLRPVEEIPIPADLRERFARCGLLFGNGAQSDVLMSYAVLRDRPDCDLKAEDLFETLAGWYVAAFAPQNHVPSACFSPEIVAHFNAVKHEHAALGVTITRFAEFVRNSSAAHWERYRFENGLDAVLFGLTAVTTLLAPNPQYRWFFAAMAPLANDTKPSFFDACIAAITDRAIPALGHPQSFSALLRGRVADGSLRVSENASAATPPDILVIGHDGPGTGLNRNLLMMSSALQVGGTAPTTLVYERDAGEFANALRDWRDGCRSRPIVVAMVNAQDIPAIFIKDRTGALDGCHIVGFFLWETSQAPRVQKLGIELIDEIWAPTKYVAGIYAPFAPTRVVGKGLFAKDAWPYAADNTGRPLNFLTVFDFHSSIERKNPLASVLAFQKAFRNGEDVELIVKAANVNPQHPGNAFGHWERLCAASAGDRRIRIVTAHYSEAQMRQLMRDASCVISLHRSEGFGYVLSDAMALGIPLISTDYSGNVDFCEENTSFPVSYRLVPVRSLGAHWESEAAEWAEADIDAAAAQIRRVYDDYPAALAKAAEGRRCLMAKYSAEAFARTLRDRIAAIRALDPTASGVH